MDIRGHPVRKVLITPAPTSSTSSTRGSSSTGSARSRSSWSAAGGVDIEEVARETPEKILRVHLDRRGLPAYEARAAARFLDPRSRQAAARADPRGLARALPDQDCSLAEINPLVVTPRGRGLALDAKS